MESEPTARHTRWRRGPRQALVFGLVYVAVCIVTCGAFFYLRGTAVDVPLLLMLGAIAVPVVVVEALTLPYVVTAMKWVFQ